MNMRQFHVPAPLIAAIAFVLVSYVAVCLSILRTRREQARLAAATCPPPVQPAWMVDNSDNSDECPACYIEHLQRGQLPRHEDGSYVSPAGAPVICARHQATPLARAIRIYTTDTNERKATR